MDLKYKDYLDAGTKLLMEQLSPSDVDEGEREAVVSAFTDELYNNIGDIINLRNFEPVIYNASIQYIDDMISNVLADFNASYADYERATKLCKKEKEIIQLFAAKKWNLPKLSNSELDKCEEILRKRQESTSIISKITEEDRRIDELTRTAQIDLSVTTCDIALGLIEELASDMAICKQKKIAIPAINNRDTKKAVRRITDIRNIAEQKESLHQSIFGIDLQIHNIVSLPKASPEQWEEVVALCMRQVALLFECKKEQWSLPTLRCDNPEGLATRYKHFLMMYGLDLAISSNRSMLSTGKQYRTFFSNCAQQQNNIETCRKNNWELPDLIVKDPTGLSQVVQEEKDAKDKAKKIKQKLILIGIGMVAVLVVVFFCIHKYREGKVQIPFDASYVSGESLDMIYDELDDAGFENIQERQDTSGWLDSYEVLSVTIDNQDSYNKGAYKKPDVSVVITYSNPDRIYVTDLIEDWKRTDYQTIVNTLEKAGFTNFDIREQDTFDKTSDRRISSLVLNGENYTNEHCYLPKNAPITVTYYTLKIGIGNSSAEFIGQDYEDVLTSLRESGFTNVQTEEINTGWAKGNTVVGVKVNNTDTYGSSESFAPDVSIVVKYSSDDRIDATSVMENWRTKNYEVLKTDLESKDFANVTVKERITEDRSINQHVAGVTIGNEAFYSGDCYAQRNAAIVIEYYSLKITVGQNTSAFTVNTKGNYSSVVASLRDMGFTNIQLLRKNDLINGWITQEGAIDSISIDGNSSFAETDSFYYDAPIIIIVHTFKNSGCEDITEVTS